MRVHQEERMLSLLWVLWVLWGGCRCNSCKRERGKVIGGSIGGPKGICSFKNEEEIGETQIVNR